MNQKNNFIVYFLFFIIALYFSQGWLYEKGNILSQTMLFSWLIIDVIYFFKYANEFKIRSLGWIIVLFMIINFASWFFGDKLVIGAQGWHVNTLGDMKNITVFLLSYFPFSYFSKKQNLTDNSLKIFFWMMLVVSSFTYLTNNEVLLENSFNEDVTNNLAYCFALLFPLLGLFFDKKIKYILLVVFLYYIMAGAKRGALVCFFVEAVLFFYFSMFSLSRKKKIQGTLGILIGLVLFVISIVVLYNSNTYLQYRLDLMLSGDESGRDSLRTMLITEYKFGNIFQKFFGRGMDQTLSICGHYAHNDWIQLLIDTGLFGAIVYLMLFINLFKYYNKNKKYMDTRLKFMYLSAVVCWILKSMLSMGYTDIHSYLLLPPIVYTQAIVSQQKK